MNRKLKKQHLIETELFYDIINVFTATFDQFSTSLLSKIINFFQKRTVAISFQEQ